MTIAIIHWPRRLLRYLVKEFGFLIFTILILILDGLMCFYTFPEMGYLIEWEVRIRHTGMYLEIFGLATAISGIIGTKRKLNTPGMIANFIEKLRRIPKPWSTYETINALGGAHGVSTASATITFSSSIQSNSIEERIAMLESAFREQNLQLNKLDVECSKRGEAHIEALAKEKSEREKNDNENLELLNDLAAGD